MLPLLIALIAATATDATVVDDAPAAALVATSSGDTAIATPVQKSPPPRETVLSPPRFDETLNGATIEVRHKSRGVYYAGTVSRVTGESLLLTGESGVATELPIADLDEAIVLKPGRRLCNVGDELTLLSRKGEEISGTAIEVLDDRIRLDFKDGTSGVVKWSQIGRVSISIRKLDGTSMGITPKAVFQPNPAYPAALREEGRLGTVELMMVVDVTGRVRDLTVLDGSHPLFVKAALAAVSKWRYEPILIDGKPIVWKSKVTLRFRLR